MKVELEKLITSKIEEKYLNKVVRRVPGTNDRLTLDPTGDQEIVHIAFNFTTRQWRASSIIYENDTSFEYCIEFYLESLNRQSHSMVSVDNVEYL